MFRELDAESWNTKGFTGSLLEKVRKELGERGAEKPKAVLLPVVKQDRAGGTEGTARPPRIGTLPSRPPGPVMLPLATETERERGGVFGGSRAGGAPQQEKKPVMLPLAGAARDAMNRGDFPKLQFSVQAAQEKPQTLPMPGRADTERGSFGSSGSGQRRGFGTSTPAVYAEHINGIIHGMEIYQKSLTDGQAELKKLKAQYESNPTRQTADAYNARLERYGKDLGVYEQYVALYQTYYDPEDIKRQQERVNEELSGLKEKKREAMTDRFLKGGPVGNLLGATWSAFQAGQEYDGQITDKEQEKIRLENRYYATDNVQALEALRADPAASRLYDRVGELQTDLDTVLRVAGDTLNHSGGPEIVADKERLLKKYGITQSAIDQYAIFGNSYSTAEDGAYTNLSQLLNALTQEIDGEKKKLSGLNYNNNSSYDYDRMAEYEQTVKDAQAAARDLEEAIQYAKDHPVLASIDTVLVSPFVGIDYLKTVIPAMINGDPDKLESYVPPKLYNMELTNYTNAVRGTVAEGIKDLVGWEPAGEFLSTLYGKGMGVADLATQAAAFGAMGALFLGSTRVATDTARSMLERGSSGTEAFWGSMAVGTANMLIYEYGVGGLMKLAGPVDPSTVEGMLSGAFKRAGVTATAGATSELSRILIDTAAMGNSSEFDLEVKRLRTEGMSAEEAWRQTFTDYVERVVDTGVRSGRYGLIAGLSEYGGEYFRQHPEAFNALVSGKTGWSGGMQSLQPGGAQGLLGLPSTHFTPEGEGVQSMPTPQGPVAVKDDWETAIEEAVTEWKESGTGRPEPESVDISGGNSIIIDRSIGGTNGWSALPGPAAEGNISVEGAGGTGTDIKYKPSSGAKLTANPEKTTTILGRYGDDTKAIIDELQVLKSTDFSGNKGGFNVLNTPDELYQSADQFWNSYNKPFIDQAIARGDDIVLATKPTLDKLYLADGKTLTGFGREYYYLLDNGYVFDGLLNMMVKR